MIECSRTRALRAGSALAAVVFLAANWACGGDDLAAPGTAALILTTATTGDDLDPDGYAYRLDGAAVLPIARDTSLVVAYLASGEHAVELTELAGNCALAGPSHRTVILVAGDTASLRFGISCSALTGRVLVTARTTGSSPDPDGYLLTVDESSPQPIGSSETVTIPGLEPGAHALTLSGLAPNCSVTGRNPQHITVVAGSSTTAGFVVSCAATGVTVVTATSGPDPDPDGYLLSVDGGEPQHLDDTGSLDLQLVPGAHQLELSGVAANCALAGPNSRSVMVVIATMNQASFAVSCKTRLPGPALLLFWGGPGTPHLYQTDGSAVVDLTPALDGERGKWSPDRSKIAFERVRHDGTEIFVMNANGSGLRRLASGRSPAWSPDGTRIVFVVGGIWTMQADGSGQTRLTDEADDQPAWSPDGKRIAFSRPSRTVCRVLPFFDVSCAKDIYTVASDGTGLTSVTHVTDPLFYATDPAWSPDGTRIAFTGRQFLEQSDVMVINPDGTGLSNLTRTPQLQEHSPIWSTDGSVVALSRFEGDGRDRLATIPAGGGPSTLWAGVPEPAIPSSWR